MARKKKIVGWIYTNKVMGFVPDEEGKLGFIAPVFISLRKLRNRMGNEWARQAIKISITIEQLSKQKE